MKGAKNMAVKALRGLGLDGLADQLAGTVQTEPPPLKTLDELKDEEKGKSKHYKDPKKKLAMMQEEWDEQSTIMDEAGKYTDQQNVQKYGKALARQKKLTILMEQVGKEEDKNKKKEKQLIKDMAVKMKQSKLLNVDISGTGQAGFDNLSGDAKQKANLLAKMFGGVRMTSGARTRESGDKAMLWSKDGMRKYNQKWQDLLTAKGISLDSAPGSEERQNAIDALREGGMMSQHEHGNAIDFSYPKGFSKDNFSGLQATLKGAFPGATLVPESDHVHMSFNKNRSGAQVAQLQANSNKLNRSSQSGAEGNNTILKQGDRIENNSSTFSSGARTTDSFQAETASG
jgi:hypothetical protein